MGVHVVVPICLIVFVIGIAIGFFIRKMISEAKVGSAKKEAEAIIEEAKKTVENEKREMLLQAKEEIHKNRVELEEKLKNAEMKCKDLKEEFYKKKKD